MTTAEIALVISLISLFMSIWSWIATRRANQFKRLSELRTKATQLRWQMDYRLRDVRTAAEKMGLLAEGAKGNWREIIEGLERLLDQARKRENSYSNVYDLSRFAPFVLPESTIEAWHHEVDRIAASVDISRKELIPELQKNAELMTHLLDQQKSVAIELKATQVDINEESHA